MRLKAFALSAPVGVYCVCEALTHAAVHEGLKARVRDAARCSWSSEARACCRDSGERFQLRRTPHLNRPLVRKDLKVIQYQSQEIDNTFITSNGTSPYNCTRKWVVKRHYREDNN